MLAVIPKKNKTYTSLSLSGAPTMERAHLSLSQGLIHGVGFHAAVGPERLSVVADEDEAVLARGAGDVAGGARGVGHRKGRGAAL